MKSKGLVVLGITAVMLGSLWVAGNVVAGPARQGPMEKDEQVRTASAELAASPELPQKMNYQGVLRDDAGNPINGPRELMFRIYRGYWLPKPGGWTELYSETQTVQVNDGLFNVVIGSVNPLDPGDFDGLTSWGGRLELGVSVDGGAELTPRVKLLSVPYAFRAEYVNGFPAPHYDSGWRSISIRPDPIQEVFTHNLGNDPDNYVVDLECKVGDNIYQCGHDRAYWHGLTGTDIYVWVCGGTNPDGIRIRMWRTD